MSPRFEREAGPAGVPLIDGYGSGGFRVAGRTHAGGVLVQPGGATAWTAGPVAALVPDDFAAVGPGVEVLLLGTGATLVRPPRAVADALRDRGIALEIMDSKAAARTYNLLATESRPAAAALLPPTA